MEATTPLSFEAYLGRKTEEQIRSYLYKLQGNAARLNGPKNAMVQRLLQSTANLGRDRFAQVTGFFRTSYVDCLLRSSLATRGPGTTGSAPPLCSGTRARRSLSNPPRPGLHLARPWQPRGPRLAPRKARPCRW
jgi:hypothetical protein